MKRYLPMAGLLASIAISSFVAPEIAAQERSADELEEIVVTGSRIRRDPLNEPVAIMEISAEDIERSGRTNLGTALQQLPITGSAVNSRFNVPGNSGFPQDGTGIGAGAVQLAIRNIGAKRTLVLVDGRRWIAGASASGVPVAVDLNTIPDNVIERVEILQDGASAIYGSDAIGGVVNVITKKTFDGFSIDLQGGGHIDESDGQSYEASLLWGGGNETTNLLFSASYRDERGVETFARAQSAFPNPFATSCDVPGSGCSSFTPQARIILGPQFGLYRNGILDPTCTATDPECGTPDITLDDGVLNDGMANIPFFNANDLNAGDFHQFTNADRFNFNGPGFNFLRTPNERVNFYVNARHQLTPQVTLFGRVSYTNRQSATKGAPEPLFIGPGSGNPIMENLLISGDNPFNPFGMDLSAPLGTLFFMGRRPLETGARRFFQDVNTYMYMMGLEGEFAAAGRNFYWDATAGYGDNRGFQEKFGSHNAVRIQTAVGDPAVCAAVPNCVPLNLFGGQGPDGSGSITQEMLDFVTFTQRDFSEQTLANFAFNIGGEIVDLPAGPLAFAAGAEYRDQEGSFRPDPIAARNETAGIPAAATAGEFDVTEFFAEVNVPLLAGVTLADYLEINGAVRSSDYSTSGSESTFKVSGLWRPVSQLSLRATVSTGFRAPGIGELFGGAAREDFTLDDPCRDYTAILGAANNGRDVAQPADIQANCASLGVPVGVAQLNPQGSALSSGNANLKAEESDNITYGIVYQPVWAEGVSWSERITFSLDFYDVEIEDAVEGRAPNDLVEACVRTLDPTLCSNVPRTPSGQVGLISNQLDNIGAIEASGFDLMFDYTSPETRAGTFGLTVNATHLDEYVELTQNPDGTFSENDLTGRHPDETFFRAFPEWRATTTLDWNRSRFSGALVVRWTDEMLLDSGSTLDSVAFTDIRASYTPDFFNEGLTITVGFNNVLDEDPPLCDACGVLNMSPVSHDLPGRVGYIRASYRMD